MAPTRALESVLDPEEGAPPAKRFKHQSYQKTLQSVHAPSALAQAPVEVEDNESYFYEGLSHWRELNLSPAFTVFARKAESLAASLPLLLHHWNDVADLWLTAVGNADDEAMRPLLDLLQKLAHDLRGVLSPRYPELLARLFVLLPRALPAATLTALLGTLSALFKFLLLPAAEPDLLEATWAQLREVLPRCNHEVQRAAAEAWGAVLRRAKAALRPRAIELLVEGLDGIDDAAAWTIVFACKSVSQTLHTATPALLGPLFDAYLASPDAGADAVHTLVRRTLTALAHHCTSPAEFAPVAQLLVGALARETGAPEAAGKQERMRRALELVFMSCAVRGGARLTQDHVSAILTHSADIPYTPTLHGTLLRVLAAAVYATKVSLFAGPARRALERAWAASPALGLQLSAALALPASGAPPWAGWAAVGAPLLLRRTPDALAAEPGLALRLLAQLRDAKRLDVDQVWKTRVGAWVAAELEAWTGTEENCLRLRDITPLLTLLPPAEPALVKIVEATLATDDADADFAARPANSALALSCALHALVKSGAKWAGAVDLGRWVRLAVQKWGVRVVVLDALVALLSSEHARSLDGLQADALYVPLQPALVSYTQALRLSALRLLAAPAVQPGARRDAAERCLQAEEAPLDVQGVRARVLRIGRLAQDIAEAEAGADVEGVELCARWLTAQLKVNLRPLWTPAGEALARVAGAHGDTVWALLFGELKETVTSSGASAGPAWARRTKRDAGEEGINEDERTWRDPTLHRTLVITAQWMRDDARETEAASMHASVDRFDVASYETQLLGALGAAHSLAEKHSRELVPLFLSLAEPEHGRPLPRHKLATWLALLGKFANPKALYQTDRLLALHTSLLAHADRALQRAALACVLAYKPVGLTTHADRLRALLDDARWRDELAGLDLAALAPTERGPLAGALIRLLFGAMRERRGRGRGADRRAAALGALGTCTPQELALLADLMLAPLGLRAAVDVGAGTDWEPADVSHGVPDKQRVGFLRLLEDVLHHLGPRMREQWPRLLGAALDLAADAQRRLGAPDGAASSTNEDSEQVDPPKVDIEQVDSQADQEQADAPEQMMQETHGEDEGHEDADDAEDEAAADEDDATGHKIVRSIRQLALRRIAEFFKSPAEFDFAPYLRGLFANVISPRLPALDSENTQAPSALLDLFRVWAGHARYAPYLVDYDAGVLPKVFACLNATNVKPAVVARIFDVAEDILGFAEADEDTADALLKPYVGTLLANLVALVQRSKDTPSVSGALAQRQLGILSRVAKYVQDQDQAATLLTLLLPMLTKSHKLVGDGPKADILKVITELFFLVDDLRNPSTSIYIKTFETLSQLFQTLRARPGRIALSASFSRLAEMNAPIAELAGLMHSLNAYSTRRMEEPDFDRRLTAFADLNERLHAQLPAEQWLPLLYNSLYFIQDPNELAIRSNCALALRNFIERVGGDGGASFERVFLRTLYPALKNGLRTKQELVRAEVLGVIAHAVRRCENVAALQEMRGLLADGDEEANFFNNILHVQVHRRTRALRRLAEYSDIGHLRNATIAEVFIPLVSNFIAPTEKLDHHLLNEAIIATGRLARHLAWGSYHALVQQYLRLSKEKDGSERVYVRTLVAVLDSFHFPMDAQAEELALPEDADAELVAAAATLSKASQRIVDAVTDRLLPALLRHLENRNEAEESVRLPIAIGVVQIALHLPAAGRDAQISRLLTVMCQIMRSKSQETRDLVRDTLRRVVIMLGPSHLALMVKELRAALPRGPQLHVLAFSVHNLLAFVTGPEHVATFSDLDACVTDAVHVAAEVAFGESGKDVQSEDFKTKMKEVRVAASKGLDTFAILAQRVHPTHISALLLPLRSILQETSSQKTLNVVDDVLRRIASGLNSNEFLQPLDLLPLCHTLISQNARFLQDAPTQTSAKGRRVNDVTVMLKRKVRGDGAHYASNAFRFVAFGLDLFNTAHRRNRFDYKDSKVIARLEPMSAVIGNTLYSDNGQVLINGVKAAVAISKCPLKSVEKALPVYVRQMMGILEQSGNTESELAQAALKSLASIIRTCASAKVKEKDLVRLLEVIMPDLEEPSRQASVFAMLRAIVSRKFVVPEIYDAMDKVAEIMVTSGTAQVQESCRGILLQFLLDYPQGKGRLANQMTFLAKNLSYVYENGRKSVMELLGAVISKFDPSLLNQYTDLLFVALVMVLANDESAKCREMSATIMQSLFSRMDPGHRQIVLSHLHAWASQRGQPRLCSVSAQVYGLFLDTLHSEAEGHATVILGDLNSLLGAFTSTGEPEIAEEDVEWRVPYHALVAAGKLAREMPAVLSGGVDWPAVSTYFLFPHAWVRLAACRLIGQLYSSVSASVPDPDLPESSPLSQAGMRAIATDLSEQLKSSNLDEALSLQAVKNLFYIGKCFAVLPFPASGQDVVDEDGESEDDEPADDGVANDGDESDNSHPLPWLFSRLSYQARSAHITRRNRAVPAKNWFQQPTAVFRWFAAMVSHMPPDMTERFLVHILSPVYRVIEDDTIHDPRMDELKTVAVELQELVQVKVGTGRFADTYNRIRQRVLGVRRERKTARVVKMTTHPAAAIKRKQERNVNKKDSRKRKNAAFSEQRGKLAKKAKTY